jgi:tripeptide aminopeptidase
MDTVAACVGAEPQIVDGVVKTDGTTALGADNKAAIAAIMCGVEDYLAKTEKHRPIEILFSVKEETGGGVELLDFKSVKSNQGIIFDLVMPIGTIAVASLHIINFHLNFKGKAAHASRPDEGKSALKPAAKLIANFQDGILDDGLTTINFGKIESGTDINKVPDRAVVSGEVRSFSYDLFKLHLAEVKKMSENYAQEAGVTVEFTTDGPCSGYMFNEDDPFIVQIAKILEQNGYKVAFYKSRGISDSNPLIEAGIKVLTLGDGVVKAHTQDEEINVQSLEDMRLLVFKFLKNIQ